MVNKMLIKVAELIGKNAVTQRAGKQLYDLIHEPLLNREKVTLDFTGVAVYSSPFFNNSIGRLFLDLDDDTIRTFLSISLINEAGGQVVKRVIENAREYYSLSEQERAKRDRISNAFFDELGGQ